MNTRLAAAATALSAFVVATTAPALGATSSGEPASAVSRWADRHAVEIPADPTRPGPDLTAVARATADALVIGLGEPGHTLAEVTTLQSRYLRHLVVKGGVRAIAWEEDWTLALPVNDYLLGRRDDLTEIMASLEDIWRTTQMRAMFRWLRAYNDAHGEAVQLAGVEYFATGPRAYHAVEDYVATHAPARLHEARRHLNLLSPESGDIGSHLRAYLAIGNKSPYLAAASALEDLVASLGPGGVEHEIALQHARQIHRWYEGFSQPWDDIPNYRDAQAAENVRWWQEQTGARTVYWASSAHVADAREITITEPGRPDTTFASAGSHLESWYGTDYTPIGFTYDHGTYRTGEGVTIPLPAAHSGWFEEPLGDVRSDQFVLTLDRPVPPEVQAWLEAPLVTRGLPEYGDQSLATGGTLEEWFDAVVHTQQVSPAHRI